MRSMSERDHDSSTNDRLVEQATRRVVITGVAAIGGAMLAGCAAQTARNSKFTLSTAAAPKSQAAAIPVGILPATPPRLVGTMSAPRGVSPALFNRALAALDWHGNKIAKRDLIAIADFTPSSSSPRLQIINMASGAVRELLVAHGSGSDPDHSGYLHRFSNVPDSECTSSGTYVTRDYYFGQHGKSQRLMGLDPTNNLAWERAIVVHGAWYANPDMIEKHGKLGRSQGCLAVGEQALDGLFTLMGEGRMIYANKA